MVLLLSTEDGAKRCMRNIAEGLPAEKIEHFLADMSKLGGGVTFVKYEYRSCGYESNCRSRKCNRDG